MLKNKIVILGIVILVLAGAGYGGYWYWNFQKIENVSIVGVKGGGTAFLLDVIKGEGLDQKNRVNLVPVIVTAPAESDRRLYAREGVDIGNSGPTTIIVNNTKGNAVRIYGPFMLSHSSLIVKKDSPYFSLKDLKDRKVGTRAARTALHENFAIAMKLKGIEVEKYFKLVFPAKVEDSPDLLLKGDLDAAVVGEPFASQLLATGDFRELFSLKDFWKETTGSPLGFVYSAAHKDWLDANKTAAKRALKTFLDAGKYINEHPEVLEKYKETLGWKTQEELAMMQKRMPGLYLTHWNSEDIKNARLILEKAIEAGIIPQGSDLDIFYQL